MADWSRIVRCNQCRKANPADVAECLHCGHELGSRFNPDPDDMRPYTPPDTSAPFVAQRAPGEIERAQEIIQEGGLFSWCAPEQQPAKLTDKMIADAENGLRVKLPASLLAILKMQNGGYPYKRKYHPDYVELPELDGIAPGCTTLLSLQEMPERIWEIFEGYLDDMIYQQWRDTFKGEVHADWGEEPKIPETILLLGDELHWGIGLDYVRCGRQGEPSVVHVEMEGDTGGDFLTELAPDFLAFLRMLYIDVPSHQPLNKKAQLQALDITSLLTMLEGSATRLDALSALAAKGREALSAVPRLTELLREDDQLLVTKVLRTLEAIGAAAQEAVPTLLELASDEDYLIRLHARTALKVISPGAAARFENPR